MYSAITTIHIKPEKIDELISLYMDVSKAILPQAHSQGLRSVRLLVNRTTGKVLTVGLWETQEQAQAWDKNPAFGEALAKLEESLAAPPSREYFEISASFGE
jgi:heme-degrading monooxygenase HmoA